MVDCAYERRVWLTILPANGRAQQLPLTQGCRRFRIAAGSFALAAEPIGSMARIDEMDGARGSILSGLAPGTCRRSWPARGSNGLVSARALEE